MKLTDWLSKHISCWRSHIFGLGTTDAKDSGLYVIGECGDCAHWGDHSFGSIKPHGYSEYIEQRGCEIVNIVNPANQRFMPTPHKQFSCIYWEKKE